MRTGILDAAGANPGREATREATSEGEATTIV
eukprot:COSAG02_NODE_48799_length_331_cov_0.853448_1_plen_31_part_01